MGIIHSFIANTALSYTCIFHCISILYYKKSQPSIISSFFFILFYVMNCVADGKTMSPYLWYRFYALAISSHRQHPWPPDFKIVWTSFLFIGRERCVWLFALQFLCFLVRARILSLHEVWAWALPLHVQAVKMCRGCRWHWQLAGQNPCVHQPRSALLTWLIPHKATRKKSLRNTWTPVLVVTIPHSFSKAKGITFLVTVHISPNPKSGMPKSRAAALWCPFRTIQLLKHLLHNSYRLFCRSCFTIIQGNNFSSFTITMTLQFVRSLHFTDLNDLLQYPHFLIFNNVAQESSTSNVIDFFFFPSVA